MGFKVSGIALQVTNYAVSQIRIRCCLYFSTGYYFRSQSKVNWTNCLRENMRYKMTTFCKQLWKAVAIALLNCGSYLVAVCFSLHIFMLYGINFRFLVILYNFNQNYYLSIVFLGVGFWNCYSLKMASI